MRKLTTGLILCLFTFNVFAADYYWTHPWFGEAKHFSSAADACSVHASFQSVQFVSDSVAYCNSSSGTMATVYRGGDSCPVGYSYNTATGACDAPEQDQCQLLAGTSTPRYVQTTLNGSPPTTIDIGGCAATFGGVIVCGNTTDGTGTCYGTATITGQKTEVVGEVAGEGVECSGAADCLAEAPEPTTETQPCELRPQADGSMSCTASVEQSVPGETTCNESGSSWICTEDPKSTSAKKKTDTTITETSNIDGTTTVVKKEVIVVTTCKGINNCTTSTSTQTTTGGTNADGSAKGDSSTCVGTACSTPDGLGGTGAGEGTDEEETPVPTIGPLEKPAEQGNFDDANDEWDQKIEVAKADLKVKVLELGELFQPIASINLTSGEGTLGCGETFTVLGQSMAFCLSKYEDQLSPIALAILFICAVIALWIVFRPESK